LSNGDLTTIATISTKSKFHITADLNGRLAFPFLRHYLVPFPKDRLHITLKSYFRNFNTYQSDKNATIASGEPKRRIVCPANLHDCGGVTVSKYLDLVEPLFFPLPFPDDRPRHAGGDARWFENEKMIVINGDRRCRYENTVLAYNDGVRVNILG
jgi:hypothetical protein